MHHFIGYTKNITKWCHILKQIYIAVATIKLYIDWPDINLKLSSGTSICIFWCSYTTWTQNQDNTIRKDLIISDYTYPPFTTSDTSSKWWQHAYSVCKQSLHSLSGRTSYRKISWSLEAASFGFNFFQSLWNLTSTSAASLSICLSNFRAIRSLQNSIAWLRGFSRFGGTTSYR